MKRFLVPLLLLTLAACSQAPAPGDEALPELSPMTFGSAGSDTARDLAKHSSGVYAIGSTTGNLYGTNKGAYDVFVSKYDTNGAVLWGRQFGTSAYDLGKGVASDGSNNAYVVGDTGGNLAGTRGSMDAFVRKYNASGGIAWTRQFGTSASDYGYGVATYGSTAVYVVGFTRGSIAGSAGGSDAFIRKYNASGSIAWTKQFGTYQDDGATAVTVDSYGNAYVVGFTDGSLGAANGGGRDMFIRKYKASGSVAWTRQLHNSSSEMAQGVAVTGSSVYLVGEFLYNDSWDDSDVRVAKYTTSGTLAWSTGLGPVTDEHVYDVSADSSGVVFSGSTTGAFTGTNQGSSDGFVYKLSSSSSFVWVQQQGTSGSDSTNAVLLRSGQVYAAGSTDGVLGGTNSGGTDAFLRRMSGTTGATVWTDQ